MMMKRKVFFQTERRKESFELEMNIKKLREKEYKKKDREREREGGREKTDEGERLTFSKCVPNNETHSVVTHTFSFFLPSTHFLSLTFNIFYQQFERSK